MFTMLVTMDLLETVYEDITYWVELGLQN